MLLAATQAEVRARREMAAILLPQARGGPESTHLWVPLTSSRISERAFLVAGERGVALATEARFVVDHSVAPGLRVTLGSAPDRSELEQALRVVASVLEQAAPVPPSNFLL